MRGEPRSGRSAAVGAAGGGWQPEGAAGNGEAAVNRGGDFNGKQTDRWLACAVCVRCSEEQEIGLFYNIYFIFFLSLKV